MGHLNLQQAFKWARDKKKGFTLIELLVVLTVVLILASIGMYLYQRSLAYAKETVCETNLRALKESIELYAVDNDALPASLGHLKLEHLEKGYARAMEDRRWVKKVCFFLVKFDASDHAYAQFLTYENLKKYGATEKIFHCPADPNGGASYGMNSNIEGESWDDVGKDVIVVADSEDYVFDTLDQLEGRHNNKALAIQRGGQIVEVIGDKAFVKEAKDKKEKGDGDDGDDDDKEKYKDKDKWKYETEDGDKIKGKYKYKE